MKFSLTLALLPSALALVIPRRDTKISDFRAYTEVECPAPSGGIFTITKSTMGCHAFSEYSYYQGDLDVQGIIGVNVRDGCTMNVYTDEACTEGEMAMTIGKCLSRPEGWGSFKVDCEEGSIWT